MRTKGTIALAITVCVSSGFLCSCAVLRPARAPMPAVAYPGSGEGSCLLVLLPGRASRPEDFAKNGFITALREAGFGLDVVAADAHMGYYRNETFIERLRDDVVAPARARGIRTVFLVGISAGGTGAILYTRAHPEDVCGILLIAPFLGSAEVVNEVAAAGGLAAFQPPGRAGKQFERDLWAWLSATASPTSPTLPILLGYGAEDEFAAGHRLLAAALPAGRVFIAKGGHDWAPWRAVWAEFLRSGALASAGCATGR